MKTKNTEGSWVAEKAAVTPKSAQHTPGPWIVQGGIESPARIQTDHDIPDRDETYIAVMHNNHAMKSGEARANARLIAAAPELLEALILAERDIFEQIRRDLIQEGCPGSHTASKKAAEDGFVRELRAAIAKATGGQ